MAASNAQTREVAKASALVTAWRKRYGTTPTRNAVVLILSVAELETNAGDFRGAHNWGQVQRRQLTPDERIQIAAGKTPPPRDASEILSTDTHPTATGPVEYSVWLWRFHDDVAGADELLKVLLDQRPSIKRAIDGLTYEGLAGLMYESKYFEGAHPRNEVGGPAANIAAYAESMRKHNVDGLLFGWMPGLAVASDDGLLRPSSATSTEPAPVVVSSPEPVDPFPAAEPETTPATPAAKRVSTLAIVVPALVALGAAIAAILHACGGFLMVPRNPFALAVLRTSTGGFFGPSAQVVDNAVAILGSNTIAVIKAVNGCDAVLKNGPLFDEWQSFTGIVEAFVKANEDSSWLSISGDRILAQVDQLQAQLDAWRKKLAAVCPDIAEIPQAPKREDPPETSLFSAPTGLIVGGTIALGILLVWRMK